MNEKKAHSCRVTSSQRVQHEKGEKVSTVERPDKLDLRQPIKANVTSDEALMAWSLDKR